jgi:hypothetical protein
MRRFPLARRACADAAPTSCGRQEDAHLPAEFVGSGLSRAGLSPRGNSVDARSQLRDGSGLGTFI